MLWGWHLHRGAPLDMWCRLMTSSTWFSCNFFWDFFLLCKLHNNHVTILIIPLSIISFYQGWSLALVLRESCARERTCEELIMAFLPSVLIVKLEWKLWHLQAPPLFNLHWRFFEISLDVYKLEGRRGALVEVT